MTSTAAGIWTSTARRWLSLYYYSYNHVKPHGSVRTKGNNRVTPAMAAGIADRPATYADLVAMINARSPKVQYAETYKKRAAETT